MAIQNTAALKQKTSRQYHNVIDSRNHFGGLTEVVSAAKTLTKNDSGKVFFCESSAGAYEITLPTSLEAGLYYKFIVQEDTPTGDITIAAGSAIIHGTGKDAGNDVGVGTAGTGVSNVILDTTAKKGDHAELHCDGTSWYLHAQSSVNNGIQTS